MKIDKKNLLGKKAKMSYLQIVILVIAVFAFSYLVAMADAESADAQELVINCCPENKDGAVCQEYLGSECEEKCAGDCVPTSCDEFSGCKLGCCFDDEGFCAVNSPKAECENDGGKWFDNAACNVQECRLGCCVLGDEASFVTEKSCERLSDFYALPLDFRGEIRTEIECLALSENIVEGACVIGAEEKSCKFGSKQECLGLGGDFYKNYLCSNSELETNCERQAYTSCIEGKDEVYWFDSCGNKENIYSSDKETSWNNGAVLRKEESCNPDSANTNSKTCGNCNYFLGSKCREADIIKPEYGDYICKDMSCKDAPANVGKQDRKNGEAWCVYDGYIGEGRDVAGSRHFKFSCINGEEIIEPCADFRNSICVQSDIELPEGGKFATASCRINRWQECLETNAREEGEGECDGVDCEVRNINIDKNFKFDVCTPKYPPGFDLTSESGGKAAKSVCSQASQKCTVVYVKKLSGWKCKVNCDCEKAGFTQQMNDFCTNLGDCGGYVNIEGEYTDDGYTVKNSPKLSQSYIDKYKDYAEPVEGQVAEPGDIDKILRGMFGVPEEDEEGEEEDTMGFGGVIGALGIAALGIKGGEYAITKLGLTGFGNALASAAAVAGITAIVASVLGLPSDAVIVAVVGALVVYFLKTSIWWGGIAGVILALIFFLLGIGKTKKVVVEFKCLPWQAPIGGDDCKKCNDPLKPCSKYRCTSLGTACKFLNEGTGSEICVASKNDARAPVISPWEDVLSPGYKYELINDGFKIRKDNDKCIDEFTPLTFGIKTDEISQCKYDIIHTLKFEDMENFFGDSNLFLFNHSMSLTLPSVNSIAEQFNATKEYVIEMYGNLKLYVRCQDDWGNFNPKEYLIDICVSEGPDKTAPIIQKIIPENNAYLAYNVSEQEVVAYINEPAECRWSGKDKIFENMENQFDCQTDLQDMTVFGWPCTSDFDVSGNNTFYFRCRDQPWLAGTINETDRNTNQQGYKYVLKRSESELKITSIEPEGTLMFGVEPATVILKVNTNGGAESGKAECEFSFTEEGSYIQFKDTFSSTHTQVFNMITRGTYKIFVRCEDLAGNTASSITRFKVKIDKHTPEIIRVYNEGRLKIITNEDAECVYGLENCFYQWENATKMTGILREHGTDWEQGRTYYIKCKDLWDNKPGNRNNGCSIIVKAV